MYRCNLYLVIIGLLMTIAACSGGSISGENLQQQILVSPRTFYAGTTPTMTIQGSNFTFRKNEIAVEFDRFIEIASGSNVEVAANGTSARVKLNIPEDIPSAAPDNTYLVTVTSGNVVASAPFQVNSLPNLRPVISLDYSLDPIERVYDRCEAASCLDPVSLTVTNDGEGVLNFVLTTDVDWLILPDLIATERQVQPGSSKTFDVQIDYQLLSPGLLSYGGTVTVQDPSAEISQESALFSVTINGLAEGFEDGTLNAWVAIGEVVDFGTTTCDGKEAPPICYARSLVTEEGIQASRDSGLESSGLVFDGQYAGFMRLNKGVGNASLADDESRLISSSFSPGNAKSLRFDIAQEAFSDGSTNVQFTSRLLNDAATAVLNECNGICDLSIPINPIALPAIGAGTLCPVGQYCENLAQRCVDLTALQSSIIRVEFAHRNGDANNGLASFVDNVRTSRMPCEQIESPPIRF